jgi:hypothetical protein
MAHEPNVLFREATSLPIAYLGVIESAMINEDPHRQIGICQGSRGERRRA